MGSILLNVSTNITKDWIIRQTGSQYVPIYIKIHHKPSHCLSMIRKLIKESITASNIWPWITRQSSTARTKFHHHTPYHPFRIHKSITKRNLFYLINRPPNEPLNLTLACYKIKSIWKKIWKEANTNKISTMDLINTVALKSIKQRNMITRHKIDTTLVLKIHYIRDRYTEESRYILDFKLHYLATKRGYAIICRTILKFKDTKVYQGSQKLNPNITMFYPPCLKFWKWQNKFHSKRNSKMG